MAINRRQSCFRLRSDTNAPDGTPTWLAAEQSSVFPGLDTMFRVRVGVDNIGTTTAGSNTYTLQYSRNGGAWTSITTLTSVVKAVAAGSNNVNATFSTERLVNHENGLFGTPGEFSVTGTTNSVALTTLTDYEFEFAIQIVSADVVAGDTIDLRVTGIEAWDVAIGRITIPALVKHTFINGSGNDPIPVGTTAINITLDSASAGGGRNSSLGSLDAEGGGGGARVTITRPVLQSEWGTNVAYVAGAPGVSATVRGNNGTDGGNSSVTATVNGGAINPVAGGGKGAGTGGTATGGDTNAPGSAGTVGDGVTNNGTGGASGAGQAGWASTGDKAGGGGGYIPATSAEGVAGRVVIVYQGATSTLAAGAIEVVPNSGTPANIVVAPEATVAGATYPIVTVAESATPSTIVLYVANSPKVMGLGVINVTGASPSETTAANATSVGQALVLGVAQESESVADTMSVQALTITGAQNADSTGAVAGAGAVVIGSTQENESVNDTLLGAAGYSISGLQINVSEADTLGAGAISFGLAPPSESVNDGFALGQALSLSALQQSASVNDTQTTSPLAVTGSQVGSESTQATVGVGAVAIGAVQESASVNDTQASVYALGLAGAQSAVSVNDALGGALAVGGGQPLESTGIIVVGVGSLTLGFTQEGDSVADTQTPLMLSIGGGQPLETTSAVVGIGAVAIGALQQSAGVNDTQASTLALGLSGAQSAVAVNDNAPAGALALGALAPIESVLDVLLGASAASLVGYQINESLADTVGAGGLSFGLGPPSVTVSDAVGLGAGALSTLQQSAGVNDTQTTLALALSGAAPYAATQATPSAGALSLGALQASGSIADVLTGADAVLLTGYQFIPLVLQPFPTGALVIGVPTPIPSWCGAVRINGPPLLFTSKSPAANAFMQGSLVNTFYAKGALPAQSQGSLANTFNALGQAA